MAASTTAPQRPPAPPTNTRPPAGAAKMAKIYLDDKGRPQQSVTAVPVDENDRRTAHLKFQCSHMRPVNGGGKERCSTGEWLLPDAERPFCPQHGKRLEPEKAGPGRLELVAREAVSLHGRSAAPWLIPLGAGLADLGAHLADLGALETGAAAPALFAGTYVVAKRTLTSRALKRGRIERGQKTGRRIDALKAEARRYAYGAGEAGLWATCLAATDITDVHPPLGLLVAGLGMLRWAFASRTWWQSAEERRNRGGDLTVHVPDSAAEATPVQAPDAVRLRAVTTWATLIGCAGGPLTGTELVDFQRLPAW